MKTYFINEAFTKGISDYLISKDKEESILYNSFLVVIIRMLINIYGELDIINPYKTNNEYSFDANLMKYGAKKEEIDNLKRLLNSYYIIEKKNSEEVKKEKNVYFIEVQKILIDLFNLKRINFEISSEESSNFFDLLYTPGTSNALRLSYNYLETEDPLEIAKYYQDKMKEKGKEETKETKNLLGFDIYKLFNVSIASLSKMSSREVDALNSNIYKSLNVDENAINKEFLLKEKIREMTNPKTPVTTGNGYVDILLIMSIIVTVIMIIVIFVTLIF